MSNANNTNYRPKSPNLSGVNPPAPPPPKLTRVPSYHPEHAVSLGFPVSARGSYDASPFFSPQHTTPSTSYFASRPSNPASSFPQAYSPQAFRTPSIPTQALPSSHSQSLPHSYDQFNSSYYPPQTHQSFTQNYPGQQQQPVQSFPSYPETLGQQYDDMPRTRRSAAEDFDPNYDPNGPGSGMPIKTEQSSAGPPPVMPIATTDPSHGIDVRTKFPVARIKRIMQADEDVGKVAQATPTAVCKYCSSNAVIMMLTFISQGS